MELQSRTSGSKFSSTKAFHLILSLLLMPGLWLSSRPIAAANGEVGYAAPWPGLKLSSVLYRQVKLAPLDQATGAPSFGKSVAISGTTAVIGAQDDESAYVFEYLAGSWVQQARLTAADGDDGDYFGYSVAISGDTIVVGAVGDKDPNGVWAGAAYVFEKGAGWSNGGANQVAKLYAADGDSWDRFGWSVAISGETIVVGADLDENPNGTYAGAVYVFEKGAGWGDGSANQVAKLDPDDGDAGDHFGRSVVISGDTIVVGVPQDEDPNGTGTGAVYVFEKGAGWSDGGANQVAKLDPDDGDSYDFFGMSVAISGVTIVIGAAGDEDPNGVGAGAVYVFEKGAGWSDGGANQVAKLYADDGDNQDYFGYSVAISGDTIAVGVPQDEDPNGFWAGAAYVFEKGAGWGDGGANQVAKLYADDGDNEDYFGYSVAISDDTIVVGAYQDERDGLTNAQGSTYVFEKGTNGSWDSGAADQAAKLLPDVGQADSCYDNFGHSVAINGNILVIGAYAEAVSAPNSGAVHVFEYVEGSWLRRARLYPGDGNGYDRFGELVAISGDTIVVGVPQDEDPNGYWAGAVYVFEKGAGWGDGSANQVAKLDPDDGDGGDYFGRSVAISGDTIVVGAASDEDPNGAGAGAVYVFERGAGWSDGGANQVAKLDPDDGDNQDHFGYSVAISGNTIVVGAVGDEDPNGNWAGAAYVFEKGAGWSNGGANQVAKLYAADGDNQDYFGYSVAISGDTIVVGVPQDEDPNGFWAGAAYVFEKGAGWGDGGANQVAKLYADDGDNEDYFGYSVAISGDTIVVGVPQDEDPNGYWAGAVYVFEKGAGWGDGGNQFAKLYADDGDDSDRFGRSVAIDIGIVAVGAPNHAATAPVSGAAYAFVPVVYDHDVYLPLIVKDS